MNNFIILSNHNTKTLSVMSKDEYRSNAQHIYLYEPISDAETLTEAEKLKQHIETISIQKYFSNIELGKEA